MKKIYKYTHILFRAAFIITFCVTPLTAQEYAEVIPMQEEEEILMSEDQLTAEQLAQPIPLDDLILGEDGVPSGFLNPSEYTLGPKDIIQIQVLRHPEVSGKYLINAEGAVQYEFVGDIKIAGLKKDAVKEVLTEKLSYYIINPEVTVKIIGFNSKIVYVVGEVSHPGKVPMFGDTITVREALVQAGLPRLSGKLKDAKLITPAESGKARVQKINVHDLLYKGDLRENLVMKPGDTLYIPPTFLAKTMRVIQPVAAPINTGVGTARRVYTGGF